jgi:hypothetical protein
MKIQDVIVNEDIEVGDSFDIELGNIVIETGVVGFMEDGVVVEGDEKTLVLLGISGSLLESIDEAKYHGREVPLGKKMAGDVKKSKVYVRGPKGNVVKVNFGDKNMRIKKSNPKRRKSFRARHNCANPGPRWKARYWSCRSW